MAVTAVKPTKNGVEKKTPSTKEVKIAPHIKTLQEKVERFEKLKGLNSKRERLATTLLDLNKFSYNQDFSPAFTLQDGSGQSFKTSNTDLLQIVVKALKETLDGRKQTVEQEMLAFEF